jgi:hypothetical protein
MRDGKLPAGHEKMTCDVALALPTFTATAEMAAISPFGAAITFGPITKEVELVLQPEFEARTRPAEAAQKTPNARRSRTGSSGFF